MSSTGYIPRYSSVDDPQFNLHGNLGYDPNLDNSVFEVAPPLVGAPRAIFDEDENQREPSPEHRMQQRGWLFFSTLNLSFDFYYRISTLPLL